MIRLNYVTPDVRVLTYGEARLSDSNWLRWLYEIVETRPGHIFFLTEDNTDIWGHPLFKKEERTMDDFVVVLTPQTIPEWCRKTGRDEEQLMAEYHKAQSQNKILYGFIHPGWDKFPTQPADRVVQRSDRNE